MLPLLQPAESTYVTEFAYQSMLMGRLQRANDMYKQAASLDDASVGAVTGMIRCQLEGGQLVDAEQQIEFMREIQQSIGESPELTLLTALLAWRKDGNRNKAVTLLDSTLETFWRLQPNASSATGTSWNLENIHARSFQVPNQNATRHVQEGTAQLMNATLMDGGLASARNKEALEARRTGLAIKMQTVQKGLEGIEHELEELETYSQKYSATFGFMCMLTELMRTGVSGEKKEKRCCLLVVGCCVLFVVCCVLLLFVVVCCWLLLFVVCLLSQNLFFVLLYWCFH